MCGEDEYDTDDTTMDYEIDDSQSVLKALEQEGDRSSLVQPRIGNQLRQNTAIATPKIPTTNASQSTKRKPDFDEIDAPSSQPSPTLEKKSREGRSQPKSKKRKTDAKQAAQQDTAATIEGSSGITPSITPKLPTRAKVPAQKDVIMRDRSVVEGDLSENHHTPGKRATSSDGPNAQLEKEESEMERKSKPVDKNDSWSHLSDLSFLFKSQDPGVTVESAGDKSTELPPAPEQDRSGEREGKEPSIESNESNEPTANHTIALTGKEQRKEQRKLKQQAKEEEKAKQLARREERASFFRAVKRDLPRLDEDTAEETPSKTPIAQKHGESGAKKRKKDKKEQEDENDVNEKKQRSEEQLSSPDILTETRKEEKQRIKGASSKAEPMSQPLSQPSATPVSTQEFFQERENDRSLKKKKKKKRKSEISPDDKEPANMVDF